MEHLVQVQAAPLPQNFELDIMTLGRNSKNVRRSDESRVSDKEGEVQQDNTKTMNNKTVTFIREDKKNAPSKDDLLNRAIYTKNVQIALMTTAGMDPENLNKLRDERFQMLQQKIELAMREYNA